MIKKVVKKSALVLVKSRKSNLGLVMAKKKSALVRNVAKKRLERKVSIDYSKYTKKKVLSDNVFIADTFDTNTNNSNSSIKKVSKFKKFIKKVMQVIKFQLNYTYKSRYNRRYRN